MVTAKVVEALSANGLLNSARNEWQTTY